MKSIFTLIFSIVLIFNSIAQPGQFEASEQYPFGQLNPSAPIEVGDYAELIGKSSCLSINRNPDGTWQDTVRMNWTFKYIMDGYAVQDYSIKEDGSHTSSIRQFREDSAKWYVTFFPKNDPPVSPRVWSGKKEANEDIVLYKDHPLPDGTPGHSRLTFYDISSDSFNWVGNWIKFDESVQFPFWMLHCKKAE